MPQSDYRIHSSQASTLSYTPVKVSLVIRVAVSMGVGKFKHKTLDVRKIPKLIWHTACLRFEKRIMDTGAEEQKKFCLNIKC